jgi:hypothetical protein
MPRRQTGDFSSPALAHEMHKCGVMRFRQLIVASTVLAAATLEVLASVSAARPPGESSARGGGSVVQGTIASANANADGTELLLKDGTRLIVPRTLNVPRGQLTAPHSVKAYYTSTERGNVVTLIEVQALHPGSGGGSSG